MGETPAWSRHKWDAGASRTLIVVVGSACRNQGVELYAYQRFLNVEAVTVD